MNKSSFILLVLCGGLLFLSVSLRDTRVDGDISGEAGGSKSGKQAKGKQAKGKQTKGSKAGDQGSPTGLTEFDIESQTSLSGGAEAKTCHTIEKEKFDKATQCVLDKIEKWVNPATGEAKIKEPMIGKDGKTYEKGKVPSSAEPAYSNVIIRQIIDSFPNSKMDKSVPEQSCPISLCPFSTPVVASDGQTYDLNALRRIPANAQGRVKSPITRELLESSVYHNLALTELIECSEEAGDFGSKFTGDKGPVFALTNPQTEVGSPQETEAGFNARERAAVRQEEFENAQCLSAELACLGLTAGWIYAFSNPSVYVAGSDGGGDYEVGSDVAFCGMAGALGGAVIGQVLGFVRRQARLYQLDADIAARGAREP